MIASSCISAHASSAAAAVAGCCSSCSQPWGKATSCWAGHWCASALRTLLAAPPACGAPSADATSGQSNAATGPMRHQSLSVRLHCTAHWAHTAAGLLAVQRNQRCGITAQSGAPAEPSTGTQHACSLLRLQTDNNHLPGVHSTCTVLLGACQQMSHRVQSTAWLSQQMDHGCAHPQHPAAQPACDAAAVVTWWRAAVCPSPTARCKLWPCTQHTTLPKVQLAQQVQPRPSQGEGCRCPGA